MASATTQGAEIDMHQDNARPSASTTILPTDLAKSVPRDMAEANSEKTNPGETKKSETETTKKRGTRQRFVSYKSQYSNDSGETTTSRKSGR